MNAFYTPSVYCTIDEQLLGFHGHCPFRVYVQNKLDIYGIVLVLCAAKFFIW
jgi:hypothetical protein